MTRQGRLDKLDRALPPDPNAPPAYLVVYEDAAGRWWEWDAAGEAPIDPATIHPRTHVVVIGERPDGPQRQRMAHPSPASGARDEG